MHDELITFDCQVRVPSWRLFLAHMAVNEERDRGNVMDVALNGTNAALRREFPGADLAADPVVGELRQSLAAVRIDPARTPPCSELLLRRYLAEGAVPRGSLAWEFLALLTAKSHAPWVVLDRAALEPPLVFRLGGGDELQATPGGERHCLGLPVITDAGGVVASPWTAPEPNALADAREVVFLCCLPESIFRRIDPKTHLGRVHWLTWTYRFLFTRTCRAAGD